MYVLPELVDASPAALNRSFEAAVPAGEDPARYAHLLRSSRAYILTGTVEQDYGAITLTVEQVAPL